jgi:lipoic acid synthetase
MNDARTVDCQILTLGQYLQPTKDHLPIDRYVHPEEFTMLKNEGMKMGFRFVESGPLVRSSYHAAGQV